MSSLALIPARGGSKRIPKKNVKPFLGKPILTYSIGIAMQSGFFDEVMVSTDDETIARTAKSVGAEVPFMRSMSNSDDYSTLADVVDEVIDAYEDRGRSFSLICCLLPTAPLITQSNLALGFEILSKGKFDSVRPLVSYDYPIQRAIRMDLDNAIEWNQPEFAQSRSQDLDNLYHDAGQFYWMNSKFRLRGGKKGGFPISQLEAQDIDDETDWKLAELKYQLLNQIKKS